MEAFAHGPGGVLFLARWPTNQLGQTGPGSTTTDKVVDMAQQGVASSLAALQFVPAGFPGAGSLKLSSYGGGQWYDAGVAPDGNGTFDVTDVTPRPESTLPGGPEGFVYVNPGSPQSTSRACWSPNTVPTSSPPTTSMPTAIRSSRAAGPSSPRL